MSENRVAEVRIQNEQGYLIDVPPDSMEAIQKATRYRPEGFQFSPAFNVYVGSGERRRRKWDGWVKLVKHSKFPSGLLETICEVLKNENVPYTVSIERPAEAAKVPIFPIGVEQRGYQRDAVEQTLLNPRGVIKAPTGSGKTAMGALIIASHSTRALVVVPTIDLLYQYREFLSDHLIVPGGIGQLGDGIVDPREVTVATVRTAAKAMNVAFDSYEYGEYDDSDDTDVSPAKLRGWIEGVGTLIVDEAHILGAQVVFDVATKLPASHKYGMSASPWRDDGADLMIEAAIGKWIYEIGTERLVKEKYLVPPMIEVIRTDSWWQAGAWGKGDFARAYKQEIVDNTVRNQRIADKANSLTTPTLILVKQINHGRILETLIDDCTFLSGSDSGERRVEVFNDLREGRLSRIIATTIADLGLDLPICQNLILAAGGKSSTRHLQRIGRVARPYPGKKIARVIDFDDSHIHKWFREHEQARRKIEHAEWGSTAIWV